ncbi:phosphoesterase [Halomicrococcus sp. NG-SE-24]|uniref:phosphoesterase n=1 Tax=Halomicrococcus sp. NG-SE-24 TaxID=3436928 RepID=UPI003D997657
MSLLMRAMTYYPYVFHPAVLVGGGFVLTIHYEWSRQNVGRSMLWRRVGAFLLAGVLSLAPTAAYSLVTGTPPAKLTQGNAWQVDALVASGLFVAVGVTWYLWRRFGWGELVPRAAEILAAVTVPYALLSPFWNVSGHVLLSVMPTLYLALVDRKFWPLLVVPVVMVPNRVLVDAHTWAQAIGAFLLATVIVVTLHRLQAGGRPSTDRQRRGETNG